MTSEEESVVAMAEQEDKAVKMAGYLDKRGKMKLVSTWKRYWFVLKDQLLLYYKSQLECLNLSACRGSLNMGLASCVRPGAHRGPPSTGAQGYNIEVVTRTQVITLRTKDRAIQEQWLKALLESMALPNISTPMRNSGGPMHFRYSLDNLPVVDELETEDKVKEKQKTLPHRTAVHRHDSILGRIKRMGGQSYGGSLDTILKHQPNNQTPPQRSPQQPKIPRIKAVERMVGLQQHEELHTNKIMEGEDLKNSEISVDNNQNMDQHLKGSSNLGNELNTTSEVSLNKISGNTVDIQEVSDINVKLSNVAEEEMKKAKEGVEVRDKNQNKEIFEYVDTHETKNCTTNFLENQKSVIILENDCVLVENKLYEKTKKIGNSDGNEDKLKSINKLCDKTVIESEQSKIVLENKLYEKTKIEGDVYNSEEELSELQQVNNIHKTEKTYEEVTVGNKMKDQKDDQGSGNEEDEYYCGYDKFSLIQSLSDQHDSSPEPDLPPRPSQNSNPSPQNKHQMPLTQSEDEDADYGIYYETTPPSQLLSSGTEASSSDKKGMKFRGKIRLKKKKSPSKESVTSEDTSNNTKKKRKMSFLRRVLKHYRKKPESVATSDNHGSSDEPEYETVDYSVAMLKSTDAAEEQTGPTVADDNSNSSEIEVHKEKLFGTKSLLTKQAMLELRMKLKGRDDVPETDPAVPVTEITEVHEDIPTEVPEKKPIPKPRPSKQKSDLDDKGIINEASRQRCNESINRVNKPPSLPPRRVARPLSPWHDVPKNNSPIYGNFQDLCISISEKEEDKETDGKITEKQSTPPTGEWDQEIQDELLGTPRGFAYIQNKWRAVEKSGEWNQGTKGKPLFQKSPQSPVKRGSREELKVKHTRSSSSESSGSNIVICEVEHKIDNDIYSEVRKEHPSAKAIIKCFNSQCENIADKNSNLNSVYHDEDRSKQSCETDNVNKGNNVEIKSSEKINSKLQSTKIGHSDMDYDRVFKHGETIYNINTDKMNRSDSTDVVFRKSQSDQIYLCNKSEVKLGENENSQVVSSEIHNGLSSSSQLYNEVFAKESRDKITSTLGRNTKML